MKRIMTFLTEHKLFIFLVFILAAYVGKINDGYVYQDAFKELGENNVYITSDFPLQQEIELSGVGQTVRKHEIMGRFNVVDAFV